MHFCKAMCNGSIYKAVTMVAIAKHCRVISRIVTNIPSRRFETMLVPKKLAVESLQPLGSESFNLG